MSGHFSSVVLNAYGAAREGLARAEERLALFPEPAILIAHIRSAEQEALGWLEGESFIPEQLAMNYGYSPRAWRLSDAKEERSREQSFAADVPK